MTVNQNYRASVFDNTDVKMLPIVPDTNEVPYHQIGDSTLHVIANNVNRIEIINDSTIPCYMWFDMGIVETNVPVNRYSTFICLCNVDNTNGRGYINFKSSKPCDHVASRRRNKLKFYTGTESPLVSCYTVTSHSNRVARYMFNDETADVNERYLQFYVNNWYRVFSQNNPVNVNPLIEIIQVRPDLGDAGYLCNCLESLQISDEAAELQAEFQASRFS